MSLRLCLYGRQSSFPVLRSTPSRTISTSLYQLHLTSFSNSSSTSPSKASCKKISFRRTKGCPTGSSSSQWTILRDTIVTNAESWWLVLKVLLSSCSLSSLRRTLRSALWCATHLRQQQFVTTSICREYRILWYSGLLKESCTSFGSLPTICRCKMSSLISPSRATVTHSHNEDYPILVTSRRSRFLTALVLSFKIFSRILWKKTTL